jgi:hypothetical protein
MMISKELAKIKADQAWWSTFGDIIQMPLHGFTDREYASFWLKAEYGSRVLQIDGEIAKRVLTAFEAVRAGEDWK